MTYIPDYKILATANFGEEVILWKFIDQDVTQCGKLVGHTSQVIAVNYLINSPLIITCDDQGLIKSWDLRNSH